MMICDRCGREQDGGVRMEFETANGYGVDRPKPGEMMSGWWDYEICGECWTMFAIWWRVGPHELKVENVARGIAE